MFAPLSKIRIYAAACSLILFFAPVSLKAAVLTGMGPNLPLPAPNPPWPPGVALTRTTVIGGFTGTWTSPANANWIGTFNATGPIPNNTNAGTTNYDFSTLPNGNLPSGTFFLFGDVDVTPNEKFDLTAFDGSGNIITSPWLNDTYAVTGTGATGPILITDMPGWDWNITTPNTYRIDGASVTGGNPSVAFSLVSNQPIVSMRLVKGSTSNSFGLQAPAVVPEPGSAVLALLAMGAWGFISRRRLASTA